MRLRTAVNAMRAAAALDAFPFTDSSLAGTVIRKVHIEELRSALAEARSILTLSAIVYTDPTLATGVTQIKRVHIQELRVGVK